MHRFVVVPRIRMDLSVAIDVPPPPVLPYRYVPWELFRDIAHALLALFWAMVGGVLALVLARRNARRERATLSSSGVRPR